MLNENVEKFAQFIKAKEKPYNVLIVDDEKWVRETFREFCELVDDFKVEMASGGQDALNKIKNNHYDLVTVDLIMPEMSGLDLLTEIKQIFPRLPVIVITGNATEKLINEAGISGASNVIYKPVSIDTFFKEIMVSFK
ncbi:MAG: response regulator [candidate division Zixibacteria bacterium]|nr:response regulator [candidate division Zixibacteria bacterium]